MKRSDGNREIDRHRDVLERIVAMLFLLAGLADLAIGLPARRRLRVFSILACGEAEARGSSWDWPVHPLRMTLPCRTPFPPATRSGLQ